MTLTWIIQRRFDHPSKDGQVGSEWPATMDRNRWPSCFGMSGHFGSESVAIMRRNMQLTAGWITLMASPAFARSISLKEGGTALWIFIIIGAIIVLLQLIPAAILFFSFIGTATTMALKKEKKVEEEVVLPGAEPVAVKK